MAIGDKKVLVTKNYVDETFDKKVDTTDDLNTFDSSKKASAKAVAILEDRVSVIELNGGGGGAGGEITQTKKTYTATANQTTFNVTYALGYIDVYLNGIKLADDDFTATNGTSVTLVSGCSEGDVVQLSGYKSITTNGTGSGGSGVSGGTLDENGNVIETSSLENQLALNINKIIRTYQEGVTAPGAKSKLTLEALSDNNYSEVEIIASSGTASKTQLSVYANNFKFTGLPTTTPALPNMIHNSGGILQITGDVAVPSPSDGQVLQYNAALGLYVPQNASTSGTGGQSEVYKAKRYIEIVAVHQSMNVLNMNSVINGVYNLYQGNIINIGAYTTTGTCTVQLMIDGIAAHPTPINVNNTKTITSFNIPVVKDTTFTFKTAEADINTKGLVLFVEIEETVTSQQSLITRYIQCPAVHKLESILDSTQVINSIFCPYRGILTKISAFTNTGTCTLKTKLNGTIIMSQSVTSTRTSVETSNQVFRLDSFDFETSNSNGTGLVIILTIEEM